MLPPNAPPEYADRNTLWNAVEKIEKQWNSQLARRFELAIPREIPPEQYADLVRDFCREFFVSKGMCVDFAIHDVDGHNPHAHVMLTLREIDENGRWLPKSRKVYDLDENGERIRLPSGNMKSHKVNTVDWNERFYGTIWRQGWQDFQNKYLENNHSDKRIDLRSYERQGLDKVPAVHMGPAATAMERRGIKTDMGNLNREISRINALMQSIKDFIREIKSTVAELLQREKEIKGELLPGLLLKYIDVRKSERKDWTIYGQNKAQAEDLKKVSSAISYLEEHNLNTADDLENHIMQSELTSTELRKEIRAHEKRVKEIGHILKSREILMECKPIYDKYRKNYFKKAKEKFRQDNTEVQKFEKAQFYLSRHDASEGVSDNVLLEERAELVRKIKEGVPPLEKIQAELKTLKDIRYWVRKVTPGTEESRQPPEKQSVAERLRGKSIPQNIKGKKIDPIQL